MSWDELIPSGGLEQSIHAVYLFLGLFMVIFALFSIIIKEKLKLSEAMVATVFGIIIGPQIFTVFNPLVTFNNVPLVILEASRVVICIQCIMHNKYRYGCRNIVTR